MKMGYSNKTFRYVRIARHNLFSNVEIMRFDFSIEQQKMEKQTIRYVLKSIAIRIH